MVRAVGQTMTRKVTLARQVIPLALGYRTALSSGPAREYKDTQLPAGSLLNDSNWKDHDRIQEWPYRNRTNQIFNPILGAMLNSLLRC